jgi:Regulator of chromosome condensation (RCC1) repeat
VRPSVIVVVSRSITTTTVYALGEGWTGALGTGRLDQNVAGHADHESDAADMPVAMYQTTNKLLSCHVGWGHTAFVVESDSSTVLDDNDERSRLAAAQIQPQQEQQQQIPRKTQLLMTGRPHEFSSLLRLQRLPHRLRQYAAHQTYQTTVSATEDNRSLHPVDLVGRAVTYLSNIFKSDEHDWEAAREQSCMVVPTAIDLPEHPTAVACSAGFTAVTTVDGSVYTFGLNGMGQCGVGHTSNNVWTPAPVTGLSREFASGQRVDLPQSHPIQQTVLGLQRTSCSDVFECDACVSILRD